MCVTWRQSLPPDPCGIPFPEVSCWEAASGPGWAHLSHHMRQCHWARARALYSLFQGGVIWTDNSGLETHEGFLQEEFYGAGETAQRLKALGALPESTGV